MLVDTTRSKEQYIYRLFSCMAVRASVVKTLVASQETSWSRDEHFFDFMSWQALIVLRVKRSTILETYL